MFLDDKTDRHNTRLMGRMGIAVPALIVCAVMLAGLTVDVRAQTVAPKQPVIETGSEAPAAHAPTTNLTTGSITRSLDIPVNDEGSRLAPSRAEAASLSLSERYFVIAILGLCFAVMGAGAVSLWRRSYGEISRAAARRRKP